MRLSDFITESKIVEFNGIKLNVSIDGVNIDIRAMDGDRQIGYVIFDRDGNTIVPLDLSVDEEHQGQGIAKTMYDYVKSLGFRLEASPDQTEAGKGFWQKHRGEERVWEDEQPVKEKAQVKGTNIGDVSLRYATSGGGLVIKAYEKGTKNPVGFVKFYKENDNDLDPQNLWVHDEYRGRGIAKVMYDYLKSEGYRIIRSNDQTSAGAGFWEKHRGEERVWEDSDKYQPPELEVGDEILKGKFKNSPAKIKGFTKDKHNQPVLKTNKGDVQLFKPRVSKLVSEEMDEPIEEAINMTHLDEPMKVAVESGIKTAIGNLYDAKGGYPKLEDRFDTGEGTSAFLNQMVAMLFSDFEKWNIVDIVTKSVVAELTKELGKNVVKKFKFMDTGDAHGQAGASSIDVNENLIKSVAKQAIENLVEATLSSYGEGELVGGFWYMINSIRRGEKDYVDTMLEKCDKKINLIASTIVHEVVHVLQHKRQKDAKHTGTEYRSYLDKKNGEFVDLHNRRWSKSAKNKLSPEEEGRYLDLYYASPQEIASFSNEIAINIIRDFDIDGARNVEELNRAAGDVDAESVIDYVRTHLRNRFRSPENKREYAVFKRYVKLTYAALQSWLTKQRERFKD